MLWLSKTYRHWRMFRALSGLAIPVLGGYFLYTAVFSHPSGMLFLLGGGAALLLAWRMNLKRHQKLSERMIRAQAKAPGQQRGGRAGVELATSSAMRPAEQRLESGTSKPLPLGGWD